MTTMGHRVVPKQLQEERGMVNPMVGESCRLLITSLGETFLKTLAEVVLVIPVSSAAAEHGFSLQNQI